MRDIVILYPTNTVAAYSTAGGKSMYSAEPAPIVSFQRAVGLDNQSGYFESFLKWFTGLDLPYSFRYLADIDMEDYESR